VFGRNRAGIPHESPRDRRSRDLLELTARIVASFVSNHSLKIGQVSELIGLTYKTLADLNRTDADRATPGTPAVPIEQSITDEYIVCLEDGRRLKTLKRYIQRRYALTPEAYRARWGLPHDYPMMAPSYARLRSLVAKRRPGRSRRPTEQNE
jgi:predicted transcriptional regulator